MKLKAATSPKNGNHWNVVPCPSRSASKYTLLSSCSHRWFGTSPTDQQDQEQGRVGLDRTLDLALDAGLVSVRFHMAAWGTAVAAVTATAGGSSWDLFCRRSRWYPYCYDSWGGIGYLYFDSYRSSSTLNIDLRYKRRVLSVVLETRKTRFTKWKTTGRWTEIGDQLVSNEMEWAGVVREGIWSASYDEK